MDKQVFYRETKKEEKNRDVIIEKSEKGRSKPPKFDSFYSMTIEVNATAFKNLSESDKDVFVLKLLMTFGNWYYKWSVERKELRSTYSVYSALKSALRERAKSINIRHIKDKFQPLSNFVQHIEKENYYEIRNHNGNRFWLHRNPCLAVGKIFV